MCVPAKKKLNLQAVMYLHTPYYCYNMYAVIYGSKLKSSIFLTQQQKNHRLYIGLDTSLFR